MEDWMIEAKADIYETLYRSTRQNIDEIGFQVMGIFGDREAMKPSFSYTIGLVERNWPEMIVFALPPAFAHAAFTMAVKRWEQNGVPKSGDIDTEIANIPSAWRELPADDTFEEYLCQHEAYYESRYSVACDNKRRVMQLIWPDRNGLFPWQPGVAEDCLWTQSQVMPFRCRMN
jgi:hypothetical protein